MRSLAFLRATALVTITASSPPVMADKRTDAVITGAANENRDKHRYNYTTDAVFYPADLSGVMCYPRARQCYFRGHYSASTTMDVFQ
jgi:hypothetical protein